MQVVPVSNYFRTGQALTDAALENLKEKLKRKAKYLKRVKNSKKLRRKKGWKIY